jgi:hypothetical protein
VTGPGGDTEMQLRRILQVLALLASLGAPALASVFTDAADRLDGEWRGGDFVLRVDAKRAQASIDAERPFAWDRFLVKEVTEAEVVFAIGAELYQAIVADDTLTLTGTSFLGERVLVRQPKASDGQ